MSENLTEASRQWHSRPDDQRFLTLAGDWGGRNMLICKECLRASDSVDEDYLCACCASKLAPEYSAENARQCEEFERVMRSIDRYEHAPVEEVDEDEYQQLLKRYEELRHAGHGPQPYMGNGK